MTQILSALVALVVVAGLLLALTACAKCKIALQAAISDLIDLFHPIIDWGFRWWAYLGPRATNLPALAVILLDVYSTASDDMRAMVAHDWRFQVVLLVLNIVARLSPHDAPKTLPEAGQFKRNASAPRIAPAASDLPAGGLVSSHREDNVAIPLGLMGSGL